VRNYSLSVQNARETASRHTKHDRLRQSLVLVRDKLLINHYVRFPWRSAGILKISPQSTRSHRVLVASFHLTLNKQLRLLLIAEEHQSEVERMIGIDASICNFSYSGSTLSRFSNSSPFIFTLHLNEATPCYPGQQ
jgi:hypothetical protein